MTLDLTSIRCVSFIVTHPGVLGCYDNTKIKQAWHDARSGCVELEGHMVALESQEESDAVNGNLLNRTIVLYTDGTTKSVIPDSPMPIWLTWLIFNPSMDK